MARQDSRHGGPEESRDTKHAYCLKASTAKVDWSCYKNPDERFSKKVFYGKLQEGKRSQGGHKKRYQDTLKASLKDFDIPIWSWVKFAQERSKWRGLINKGAALYEKKTESVKLSQYNLWKRCIRKTVNQRGLIGKM